MLRRAGVQVTVYDRYDRAGGLMTYGIPGFKLEKDVVMRRIEQLEEGGVTFVLNCNVGEDITFDAIRGKHDAVLIATGVYKSRDLQAPGVGAKGIVRAIDYLTASNRKSFGDEVPEFDSGELNAEGKRVVVIGGGDTAMDCVRTAIRQGATSVKCLYRRDRANMPGIAARGGECRGRGRGIRLAVRAQGLHRRHRSKGVMVQRMRLGAPDATGRQMPELIEGADYVEDADLVIKALGFEPEDLPTLWGVPRAGGDALGHGQGRLPHPRRPPAGRLCGGRHRARREPGGLGDPRRARGGRGDPRPSFAAAAPAWRRSRRRWTAIERRTVHSHDERL